MAPPLTTQNASKPPAATTKPTLLHLQHSSSQIVIWVLEELSVDYDIIAFLRPEGPAHPDLKKTHPQGKSPQLLLPDGRVLTQLSAIIIYLLNTYDTSHEFHHPGVDDPVREEYLSCLGVSDIASKLGIKFLFHGITLKSPFFIRPLFNTTRKYLNRLFLDADLKAVFDVMEMELEGREWFMGGEQPGRPDFILRFFTDLAVQPGYFKLDEGYPRLKAWWERCDGREAWKRSLERGNGYDLDFPGKW